MVCGVLKDCSAHLWAKGAASAIPGVIFASKMRKLAGRRSAIDFEQSLLGRLLPAARLRFLPSRSLFRPGPETVSGSHATRRGR